MTARVIGIVSGKGGVGKTVTTINLGLSLYQLNQDITIVDADMTVANLGIQLGMYSFPTTLQDVLNGTEKIHKSIYTHPLGLKIIPSSISLDSINVDMSNLRSRLDELEGIVLIDSPPGLGPDAQSVLRTCDDLIVVTNPEMQTMTNALKVIQVALGMGKTVLGVIINRYSNRKYDMTPSEIKTMCEMPILCKIPEDRNVKMSLFQKTPILSYNPYSPASIEFQRLAYNIMGMEYVPPNNLLLKKLLKNVKTML